MTNKKIYIALPINGVPDADEKAARIYRVLNNRWSFAVNPYDLKQLMDINHAQLRKEPPTDVEYLVNDLREIATCDGIFLCKGWENSLGCMTEYALAKFIQRSRPDFIIDYEVEPFFDVKI